jgi:hypothetical protein
MSQFASLAEHFRYAAKLVQAAMGRHVSRNRALNTVLTPLYLYVQRTANRFEALFNKWKSGKLPIPHATTPRPKTEHPAQPNRFHLPTRRLWLADLAQETCQAYPWLESLLNDPEMAAFIAAAPQVLRLVRPLANAVGVHPGNLPEPIRPLFAPRPRRKRAPKLRAPDPMLPARQAARASKHRSDRFILPRGKKLPV